MAEHSTFRHPYEELRQITALPLGEVALLGRGEPLDRLAQRLRESALVGELGRAWSARTRLLIASEDPTRLSGMLTAAPPSRTCVVLDLGGDFPAAALPHPGMCLRAALLLEGEKLHARLLPRAGTIPEALELVAELLYALSVTIEQRPVDGSPG
ncbi:MAG: hypothetical protein ABI333_21350 [bacterium]